MKKLAILSFAVASGIIFSSPPAESATRRATRTSKRSARKRSGARTANAGVYLAAPLTPTVTRMAPRQTVLFCVKRESLWGAHLEMNDAMVAGKPILYWRTKEGGKYLKPPFTFGPFLSEREPSGAKPFTLCAQVAGTM